MKTLLTGVKPTGYIHIGNLVGAIKPALELVGKNDGPSLFFIADYHALTFVQSAAELRRITREVAAAWLALGLDPKQTIIYRQSDVPEIFELHWILSCYTPKGFMNRAHAYKAQVAENELHKREDLDTGVNIGLFTYPVLMSADILIFDADIVPVGRDQIQHIEFARDIAQKFNNATNSNVLKLPQAHLNKEASELPGLDGRKMSKSYDNGIPVFAESAQLKKLVAKIKTDSSLPTEPKDPKTSILFQVFSQFAKPEEINDLSDLYRKGVGWGEVKNRVYEVLDRYLKEPRRLYNELLNDEHKLESILQEGAQKARSLAKSKLAQVRNAIGTNP